MHSSLFSAFPAACVVCAARLPISSTTSPKRCPDSLARAPSIAALIASRLVCQETAETSAMTVSISRVRRLSRSDSSCPFNSVILSASVSLAVEIRPAMRLTSSATTPKPRAAPSACRDCLRAPAASELVRWATLVIMCTTSPSATCSLRREAASACCAVLSALSFRLALIALRLCAAEASSPAPWRIRVMLARRCPVIRLMSPRSRANSTAFSNASPCGPPM